MSYELIITEKPSSAKKIAEALADSKAIQKKQGTVSWFELTYNKKPIVIVSAVGHLFTVAEKNQQKKWTYPVFDLEWVESAQVNKASAFTSKYVSVIKKIAKDANEFTVATDYDIEGEVIGLNVILYLCGQKDANRMKFSTLTKADLRKAYDNKSKTLDWGQGNAGRTRHELDWYYGINLSRALSQAIQKAGRFKILSSGRVQGPALKILVDKEAEIQAFIPTPYWEIYAHTPQFTAQHKDDKIDDKQKAFTIYEKVKDAKEGRITDISSKRFEQAPPTPFDLTTLQMEAHRCFKITPKDTLSIAQDLYSNGYISYPRTSSQKLPAELGLKNLIENLKKQSEYAALAEQLLSQPTLKPNEGKKTDDAHPSIFPTGQKPPAGINDRLKKIYDLVVRRFLATFATPATRETMTVTMDVKEEPFIVKGTRTITKGWHVFYGPYVKLEEVTLPALSVEQIIPISKIDIEEKQTKPPRRYTAASIIAELEKQGLGTKATRAQIVDNLYERGYVNEKSIQATDIGIKTCHTLEKYCPKIVDVTLTREFENEMEDIRHNTKEPEQVLSHAKNVLSEILSEFKQKEKEIGSELLNANADAIEKETTVGTCPVCTEGTLKIRRGKFGLFIACDRYPDCKATVSLPKGAKVTEELSDNNLPVLLLPKGQKVEITKDVLIQQRKEPESIGRECPSCGANLIKRKGMYGEFIGCSAYPKCRYMEKINKDGTTTPVIPKTASAPAKKAVKKKTTKKKTAKKSAKK